MRRSRRHGSGQALVEFALVAPLLFLLLLGIIEAGRFIYHYETLNNAARAGVRYAIIHGAESGDPTGPGADMPANQDPDGDAIQQAVSDAMFGLLGTGDMSFPETPPDGPWLEYSGPNGATNKRGSNVYVKVGYTYQPIVPILPTISISAEANGVVNN